MGAMLTGEELQVSKKRMEAWSQKGSGVCSILRQIYPRLFKHIKSVLRFYEREKAMEMGYQTRGSIWANQEAPNQRSSDVIPPRMERLALWEMRHPLVLQLVPFWNNNSQTVHIDQSPVPAVGWLPWKNSKGRNWECDRHVRPSIFSCTESTMTYVRTIRYWLLCWAQGVCLHRHLLKDDCSIFNSSTLKSNT